jgi:uncharacterized protein YoaH (UPF0181 family)
MAKMTKTQARRRLNEAANKILNVMLAGHMSSGTAVKIAEQLTKAAKRLK